MVSREKGWAAAFRASPGTLAAPVTGVLAWWKLTGLDHSTAYGSFGSWGVVPDALCFCFADAHWWLRGICNMGGNASANVRVRQRKRERRSIREGPGVLSVSRADTEGTANNDCRAKAPVTGRNKAFQTKFEMPPPQPFLLHHQKAHSLFPRRGAPRRNPAKRLRWGRGGATERYEGCPPPQGVPNIAQFDPTTNGGFEAAGLLRHSRPDGKRFCPAAEPQSLWPSPHHPRARDGRTSALPRGRHHKSRRASPAPLKPLCTASRTPPVGCRGGPSRSECRRSPRPA